MPKYRKKPVVIEAEIYRPGLEDDFICGCDNEYGEFVSHGICERDKCEYWESNKKEDCPYRNPFIKTLEGNHFITEGDYIITGIKGERYPCKPDIFEQTYELAE